jgi:hypothetical protein
MDGIRDQLNKVKTFIIKITGEIIDIQWKDGQVECKQVLNKILSQEQIK